MTPKQVNVGKIIASVLNVFLVTALIASIVVKWKTPPCSEPNESSSSKEGVADYCFLSNNGECNDEGMETRWMDAANYCCTHLDVYVTHLMEEVFDQLLRVDFKKEKLLRDVKQKIILLRNNSKALDSRPAAHVGILPEGNSTGKGFLEKDLRIPWEMPGSRSFVSGGLSHEGNSLLIPKQGYYFIYTGLLFQVDPKEIESEGIIANVSRNKLTTPKDQGTPLTLMMARESSCKSGRRDRTGPVSIYMAGVFHLHPDDVISVETSNMNQLQRSPHSTYLGIYLV